MAQFPANPNRLDPYKNFKFRIKWDGTYVAGISHVSALRRSTEVIEFREGGDPSATRRSPGVTHDDAITLERGLTQDHAFEQWTNKVWLLGAGLGGEVSFGRFSKRSRANRLPRGGLVAFGANERLEVLVGMTSVGERPPVIVLLA